MTAQEAAQLFVEGKHEECRDWCRGDYGPYAGSEGHTRTAAVALELWQQIDSFGAKDARDFLRMIAGEDAE